MLQGLRTVVAYLKKQEFHKTVSTVFDYLRRQYLFLPFLSYAISAIRRYDATNDFDTLVDFSYSFWHGFIKPFQVRYELAELVKYVNKEKPGVILEIGTALGGTLFLFCRAASENAVLISVDLPLGKWGGGYSRTRIPLYESFPSTYQHLHLIRGDSHNREVLEEVKTILQGKKVDFLFIDGDHSYEGVRKDFDMYSPLVKINGIIAFHDVIKSIHKECDVCRFWDELASLYEHRTIVENDDQQWAGIGIIVKK